MAPFPKSCTNAHSKLSLAFAEGSARDKCSSQHRDDNDGHVNNDGDEMANWDEENKGEDDNNDENVSVCTLDDDLNNYSLDDFDSLSVENCSIEFEFPAMSNSPPPCPVEGAIAPDACFTEGAKGTNPPAACATEGAKGTNSSAADCNTEDLERNTANQDLLLPPAMDEASLQRMGKFLNELPHLITMKLTKSLDCDSGWENLVSVVGMSFDDHTELKLEERRINGSPAEKLLWRLGSQGYTAQMLYEKFQEINRRLDAETMATYIMRGEPRPKLSQAAATPICRNSESLNSMLSSISFHNVPQPISCGPPPPSHPPPSHAPMASRTFRGGPSEVNFNHSTFADKSQTKLAGIKLYEDKTIPGASKMLQHSSAQGIPQSPYLTPSSNHQPGLMDGSDISYSPNPSMSVSMGGYPTDPATQLLRQQNNSISQSDNSRQEVEVAMSVKTSFSYKELHSATEGFDARNILGEGGFGVVYKGQLRRLDCAVKRFIKTVDDKKTSTDQLNSELAALLKYQHENIVTLYGYASDGPELCLVYQYLSNGSLEDRLSRKNDTPSLSWERRLNILVGSCKAINFLHCMGLQPLIHGDVKSANILLDKHLEAKFADLGQSRYATSRSTNTGAFTHITLEETKTRQFGTHAYQSVENRSGCRPSTQSDIYALGVVILEICSGLPAFDFERHENKFLTDFYSAYVSKLNDSDKVLIFQDSTTPDTIPLSVFLSLLKLAQLCMKELKKSRPTSQKLLTKAQEIYDGHYKRQPVMKSFNSPIEDDVSTYQSNIQSGQIVSDELNSHITSPELPSIHRYQNEILQQISMKNQGHHQSLHSYSKDSIAGKITQTEVKGQDTAVGKVFSHQPAVSSQAVLTDFSTSHQRDKPEAVIIQEYYDDLSGQLHSQQDLTSNVSELSQGQRLTEGDDKSNLSSDPEKLAAMHYFDRHGFTKSVDTVKSEDTTPASFACDERKMAYLNQFDEGVFSSGTGNTDLKTDLSLSPGVDSRNQKLDLDKQTYQNERKECERVNEGLDNCSEVDSDFSNQKNEVGDSGFKDHTLTSVDTAATTQVVSSKATTENDSTANNSIKQSWGKMFENYNALVAEGGGEEDDEGEEEEDCYGNGHRTTFL